jgi:two-component system, LuxR family, sensor kinase FixL
MITGERYRRASLAGRVGVWDWNLVTNEIYVDPILKEMLGYEDREIPNDMDHWGRLVHPDDAPMVDKLAEAHIAGETPLFQVAHRMLHRDGSIRWFLATGTVVRDADGRAVAMAGADTEITEHKLREEALRQAEERNHAMLRAIPDSMFLITADGVYLDYHAKKAADLYAEPSDFLGKSVTDVLPRALAKAVMAAVRRVIASDVPETIVYSLGEASAEKFYEASIVKCNGDKALSIVRNVTDRKHAELEAAAHRRELTHLGRVAVLGELTGALAHELRQPLTAMRANAAAARSMVDADPIPTEALKEALDDIIQNNRWASAVINRQRALLRKADTEFLPMDLNELIDEVVQLAHGEILGRRITVEPALRRNIPLVAGDRVQLQQVILNLVLNACDAMSDVPAQRRRLSIATQTDGECVQLSVSDQGTGIPEGELERVFEPFVSLRESGLGLGLAISRSIVMAHGGSIRAQNNGGGGATFRCRFPAARTGEGLRAG